uniref:Sulfotransferase n=1 Tax=Amphiprion percula TaxID=161767 RepID=A0A3P8SJZ4_AMPPE
MEAYLISTMDAFVRPELVDFNGISMTRVFTSNWENVQNFQARPDDILIATYAKAGTTWVSQILDLLYFGQTERQKTLPIHERVPFLEVYLPPNMSGTEQADNLPTSPRLIKTHLPYQLVPKSFWEQNCRVVYVARNAKDNMVSYYHFNRMSYGQPAPGDWNTFFQNFMEGKSMYEILCGVWTLVLLYLADTEREIDKLCSFLGLSPSAEEKKMILGGTQFDNMRKNYMANYSTFPLMDFKISPFMRKGKVGDWKNHFTVAQNEEFDEDYKTKMTDPTLEFRTTI